MPTLPSMPTLRHRQRHHTTHTRNSQKSSQPHLSQRQTAQPQSPSLNSLPRVQAPTRPMRSRIHKTRGLETTAAERRRDAKPKQEPKRRVPRRQAPYMNHLSTSPLQESNPPPPAGVLTSPQPSRPSPPFPSIPAQHSGRKRCSSRPLSPSPSPPQDIEINSRHHPIRAQHRSRRRERPGPRERPVAGGAENSRPFSAFSRGAGSLARRTEGGMEGCMRMAGGMGGRIATETESGRDGGARLAGYVIVVAVRLASANVDAWLARVVVILMDGRWHHVALSEQDRTGRYLRLRCFLLARERSWGSCWSARVLYANKRRPRGI